MTLPTSGPISLYDIAIEFGQPTTNVALQDYYAGGGIVPPGTTGIGPVPSSGPISVQDFYGVSGSPASPNNWGAASDYTIGDVGNDSQIKRAEISFDTDGVVRNIRGVGADLPDGSYSTNAPNPGEGSAFSARATLQSGTSPAGDSLNTWLVITSARNWFLNTPGNAAETCDLNIEIRHDATNDIQSNVITLSTVTF